MVKSDKKKKKNRSQSRQNRMIKPETARRKEPTMMTRAHSPETEKKASQHQTKDRNRGLRELRGSIRALEGDGNERTFELSFSSEEPYTRWFGQEILDHSAGCVDLTRLNEIGCVLFNHDRDEVIGKITKAWIDNGRGMATIEFDSDEASEVIYQKVKGGTLKGVSVGYLVDNWEEVMPNKQSAAPLQPRRKRQPRPLPIQPNRLSVPHPIRPERASPMPPERRKPRRAPRQRRRWKPCSNKPTGHRKVACFYPAPGSWRYGEGHIDC